MDLLPIELGDWSLAMAMPEWLFPAVLGAALAAGFVLLGRLVERSGAAGRAEGPRAACDRAADLIEQARRLERGLRELTLEAEARLDARLDRLEALLAEANRLEGGARESGPAPAADPLGSVSAGDRRRVLELASLGKLPEAIAESVGLLRGEVDLILNLHKTAQRVEEP